MDSFETVATTILLTLATSPLLAAVLRRFDTQTRWLFGIGLLLFWSAVVWTANAFLPVAIAEADVRDRPIETPNNGYVSSASCRACHPSFHATWDGSYHSKMTQVASDESVVGDFDGANLHHRNRSYHLSHKDGNYFVDIRRNGEADGAVERRRIVMTTGSHHRQWVWMDTGDTRKIEPFPFLYLIAQQRWIPLESSFLVPPHLDLGFQKGAWNENCIQCHTTQGRMRKQNPAPGVLTMDTRVGEFGIACEACHGPAEEHIRANRDPARRQRLRTNDEPDPTIVNPARLSSELSAHVCGQCHAALSLFKSKNRTTFRHWNTSGFDFRPGDDLKESRYLVGYEPHMRSRLLQDIFREQPDYIPNRFWSDGVIRVAGREFSGLLKTPCYQHDDPTQQMSCLSCHALHQPADDQRDLKEWANDQLKPGMEGNQACTQCHSEIRTDEQLLAHTHHESGTAGSLCYNCHMPHTTFGLLKAIRSHGLVSPSVQSSLDTGRPNACNLCHLDQTLGWTAEHLTTWYGQDLPTLSPDEEKIAASVLWTLRGDAGQRGLMAWSMGWQEAQQASGTHWLTPYLAELMKDPYDAVRFVAYEALKSLRPDNHQSTYDFLAPEAERDAAAEQWKQRWEAQPDAERRGNPALLVDENGELLDGEYHRLLQLRDHRPVNLQE